MTTGPNQVTSYVAGQAFTVAHQYHAVMHDVAGSTATQRHMKLATIGAYAVGILQEDFDVEGTSLLVVTQGSTTAIAGAAVAIGNRVKVNASSRLIPVTTALDEYVGVAGSAASADGERFELIVNQGRY